MALNITSGYSLSPNDSSPGVLNFWFSTSHIVPETIQGFATNFHSLIGVGNFHKFECANGEGDFVVRSSIGEGGKRYETSLSYRIGGLSEDKLRVLDSLLDGREFSVLAEMRDQSVYYLSRGSFTHTGGNISSGSSGAASIGSTITFAAVSTAPMIEVAVPVLTGGGGVEDIDEVEIPEETAGRFTSLVVEPTDLIMGEQEFTVTIQSDDAANGTLSVIDAIPASSVGSASLSKTTISTGTGGYTTATFTKPAGVTQFGLRLQSNDYPSNTLSVTLTGTTAVQGFTINGTRSNLVVSSGSNSVVKISLADEFDSGAHIPTTFTRNVNTSTFNVVTGRDIQRLVLSRFRVNNVTVEIILPTPYTIQSGDNQGNITDAVFNSLDGMTIDGLTIGYNQSTRLITLSTELPDTLSYGFSTSPSFRMYPNLDNDDDGVGNNHSQPITTQSFSSTFTFDPDLTDTTYTTSVPTTSFVDNSNTNTALTLIGNTIAALETDITFDGTITTGEEIEGTLTRRSWADFSGALSSSSAAWRFCSDTDGTIIPLDGSATTTLEDQYIYINGDGLQDLQTNTTYSATLGSVGSWNFELGDTGESSDGYNYYQMINISEAEGNLSTDGTPSFVTLVLTITGTFDASSIEIDLGVTNMLDTSLSINTGSGTNVYYTEEETSGSGTSSSGTASVITINSPSGNEVAVITSSVDDATDNNVDTVGMEIVTAINAFTEMPINFDAAFNTATNMVILTANEIGTVVNPFTFTIDHSTGDGDISFSTITQTTI